MAFGLLVWLLLMATVASLSTEFRSDDWYLDGSPPSKEVHNSKPKPPPKEELFRSRSLRSPPKEQLFRGPDTGRAKTGRRKYFVRTKNDYLADFVKLFNLPQRDIRASVLRGSPSRSSKVPSRGSGASAKIQKVSDFPLIPRLLRGPNKGALKAFRVNITKNATRNVTKARVLRPDGPWFGEMKPFGAAIDNKYTGSEVDHIGMVPEQSTALHANRMKFDVKSGKILAPTIFVLAMLAVIFAFTFCFVDTEDAVSDEKRYEKWDNAKLCYPKSVDDAPCAHTANTKEKLLELQNSPGTWARTYRRADRGSKEALELLFRCNIIPAHEFAESCVSQEHIDECVWISTQMLREKSLEEWVEAWPQAMKTFEESVTACFAARTDVISNLYGDGRSNSPGTPKSDRGFMDCRPGTASNPRDARSNASTTNTGRAPTLEEEQTVTSQVRNVLSRFRPNTASDLQDVKLNPRVNVRPPQTAPETDYRISVVSRCREIMSSIPTRVPAATNAEPDADENQTSPVASPASTSPSLHRDLLPTIPASVDVLSRLDSYPPSQGVITDVTASPDCPMKTETLRGSSPMPGRSPVTSVGSGGFGGLFGTLPGSGDLLPGTTPQPKELAPRFGPTSSFGSNFGGALPGTTPQPKEVVPKFGPTSSFGAGLSGTTPQPKERGPSFNPTSSFGGLPGTTPQLKPRSLSPQEVARRVTPLFGRPSANVANAALPSSSEDPFASLKDEGEHKQ